MGKIKPKRQRNARYNPTGLSSNAARDDTQASVAGLKAMAEKISSVVVDERVDGLNTLAAVALDEASLGVISRHAAVEKVAPLLNDPSLEVRLAAAGALRNISAGGSDEVVEAMVQQEVLPPLAKLLQEYREPWTPANTNMTGELADLKADPRTGIFIQATHLLWNLCECNEEAVSVFNREGLVQVLLQHLDPACWGHAVALAAAECLLCVSENNANAASVLLPNADSLLTFVSRPTDSPVDLRFAITIAGLLLNLNYCTSGGDNFQVVVRVLAAVLEPDTLAMVLDYISSLSGGGAQAPMPPQDLEHLIVAQQLALEVLSNVCCPDDDEDGWDDCGSGDGEEGMCEDDEDAMDLEDKFVLPPEVIEGIKHYQLFEKSLKKVQYPEESVVQAMQSLKYGPSLLNKLGALRVRALLGLQNMVPALELSELGGSELLYSTWVHLGNMVFKGTCTDNPLLEAASGAMRALMDRLSHDKCDKLAGIMEDDLKVIFEAGVSCPVGSVRSNVARMVGTLGCLVVTQNTDHSLYQDNIMPVLKAITTYLLKVAGQDKELWVCAEALDVIIDLYSDDKTDRLAATMELVEALREIQPQFKAKHAQQKKQLGEHRALVLTVRDNLVAFIKYKAARTTKTKT